MVKYPIGIQDFESLRKNGYLYVDKTAQLHRLVNEGKYFFLSRPRRFGKSLLLSTLEAYFRGQRSLFQGLAIDSLETHWRQHPVIHIDLNIGLFDSVGNLRSHLNAQLSHLESIYGSNPAEQQLSDRLAGIIRRAADRTGIDVVILIDEYDKPILAAIGRTELQAQFKEELRAFYSVIKSMDRYIRFAFLTGVTKFGRLSVFSGLNNLNDITFDPRYADICGITEAELTRNFSEGITLLAQRYKVSDSEMVGMLRQMYDGYRFSESETRIFNPFSLLCAFNKTKLGYYWFETGTPRYLVDLLKKHNYPLSSLEGIHADETTLSSIDPDTASPIPVIFQSGYITITGYDSKNDDYTLGIPNREVRKGFMEYLIPYYLGNEVESTFDIKKFRLSPADLLEHLAKDA